MLATVIFGLGPAFSQAPTDAQRSVRPRRSTIRHCASVPPWRASLQCLQQNMSSLSSSCQTAVPLNRLRPRPSPPRPRNRQPSAEAPAEAPGRRTAPKQPKRASLSAIRSACRSDYQRNCAGVLTGGASCAHAWKKTSRSFGGLPAGRQRGHGGATTCGGRRAATAATSSVRHAAARRRCSADAAARIVLRSACGGDVRARFCGGIAPGGGRTQCLATQAPAFACVQGKSGPVRRDSRSIAGGSRAIALPVIRPKGEDQLINRTDSAT